MKQNFASTIICVLLGLGAFYVWQVYGFTPAVMIAMLVVPTLLVYTLGPIAIYATVRNSSRPKLEPVQPADPSVPSEQCDTMLVCVEALHRVGFVPAGNWFRSSEAKNRDNGVLTVLQHHGTSDIATVIAFKSGVSIGFSVLRKDGTKIRTCASTQRNPLPNNPKDSLVRMKGDLSTEYLWMLHTTRVGKDKMAIENPPLANAFKYQLSEEIDSLKQHVNCGYFVTTPDGASIRPTVWGALMMTLRMASPTALLVDWSERQHFDSIVKKLHLPTPAEFKAQQSASQSRQEEVLHVPPGTRTAMA